MFSKLKERLKSEKGPKPGKGCIVDGCNEPRDTELFCEAHENLFAAMADAKRKLQDGRIGSAHLYNCGDCNRLVVAEQTTPSDPPECPECGSTNAVAVEITPKTDITNHV